MNAIELNHLSKHYPGFTLGPLDLTLPSGCILGLVGENGAGKTTMIKLILDMIRRDGGEAHVLDDVADQMARREQIGVVLDEVGIPECLNARQLGKIMALSYRNWEPDTYERLLRRLEVPQDKRYGTFSRGTKMKLGIAVALSHRARLLILDEATSGLDPVVREQVLELFSEFTRDPGNAVLISSHIVSDLEKICDYIAFLHRGKLLLCEEKDELLAQYGLLNTTRELLRELEPEAVLGMRDSGYGVQAVVRRDAVPASFALGPVDLEELFVFMAKEAC